LIALFTVYRARVFKGFGNGADYHSRRTPLASNATPASGVWLKFVERVIEIVRDSNGP
jgi:hypothetical protein